MRRSDNRLATLAGAGTPESAGGEAIASDRRAYTGSRVHRYTPAVRG